MPGNRHTRKNNKTMEKKLFKEFISELLAHGAEISECKIGYATYYLVNFKNGGHYLVPGYMSFENALEMTRYPVCDLVYISLRSAFNFIKKLDENGK